jgi:hypothetical protein
MSLIRCHARYFRKKSDKMLLNEALISLDSSHIRVAVVRTVCQFIRRRRGRSSFCNIFAIVGGENGALFVARGGGVKHGGRQTHKEAGDKQISELHF